jgi:hypothetical protein
MADKIDRLKPSPFKDGPGEFLTAKIAEFMKNEPHFNKIFGDSIDDYDREDYSLRELPALRFYNFKTTKLQESHYIIGEVFADIIWPFSIRRDETEKYPSQVANALLQQFRRPSFFNAMRVVVPGLNELGKTFDIDKSLGFMNEQMGEEECPVTHMTLNFRLDLKEWDAYLETQGRTKDDPFDITLENLRVIASNIQAIRDGADLTTKDVEISSTQTAGGAINGNN